MMQKAPDISVEILESEGELAAFLPQWVGFLKQAPAPEFYQDPNHILIDMKFGASDQKYKIVVVKNNHQPVGVASFAAEDSPFDLSLGLVKLLSFKLPRLRMLGSQILVSNNADKSEVVSALSRFLLTKGYRFDAIEIDQLRENSDLKKHSEDLSGYSLKAMEINPAPISQLILPSSHDELMKSIHKKKERHDQE